MREWVYLIIFFNVFATNLFAFDDRKDKVGLEFALHRILNYADFKELPGIPNCCPRFEEGFDNDYGFTLLYRFWLNPHLDFQLNFRYNSISGKFSSVETEYFGYKEGIIEGEFRHELNANIDIIGFIPQINYKIGGLNLNLGLSSSFYLNKEYNQREFISKPQDRGTFLDSTGKDTGSRIRNQNSGKIPLDESFAFSVIPSISYQLPLNANNSISIEPKIGSELYLTQISKSLNWRTYNIFAALAITFKLNFEAQYDFPLLPIDSAKPLPIDSLPKSNQSFVLGNDFNQVFNPEFIEVTDTNVTINKKQGLEDKQIQLGKIQIEYDTLVITRKVTIRKTKYRYDTLEVSEKNFFCDFDLYEDKQRTQPKKIDKIYLNQVIMENEFPILNSVFYEDNQIEIPDNFNFKTNNAKPVINELDNYDNLFNVLKEINEKQQINDLKLIAYLGFDSSSESSLIDNRTELLKIKLIDYCKIEADKIKIIIDSSAIQNTKDLKNRQKIMENRKIDIVFDNDNDIIYHKIDTIQKVNPNFCKLLFENKTNETILNWKVSIVVDNKTVKEVIGKDSLPAKLELELNDIAQYLSYISNFVKFYFQATSTSGKKFDKEIIKLIDSKNFENKSLLNQDYEENYKSTVILFDYNSYELNKQAINILNTIKTKLTDKSEIEIIGFTDETGDSKYNKLLSEKRAYEVANYIQATNMSIKGAGTSKLSILRNSPESNLYSRSVRIIYNVK